MLSVFSQQLFQDLIRKLKSMPPVLRSQETHCPGWQQEAYGSLIPSVPGNFHQFFMIDSFLILEGDLV